MSAAAFVLKAKAIIIGLSLAWVLYLAWPGLVWHCMPKFWGHKTAKHANTHRQQRCRHQARGMLHTIQCGHTGTRRPTRARWGPCHLTHLPRWPFVVCALHNKANPSSNSSSNKTGKQEKTTLWFPANSPKMPRLKPQPFRPTIMLPLPIPLPLCRKSRHPILPQSTRACLMSLSRGSSSIEF